MKLNNHQGSKSTVGIKFLCSLYLKKILFRRYKSFRLTTFSLIIITRFTFWQSLAPVNEHVD